MLKATPVFYYSIHKHLSVEGEDNHPGLIVGEPFIRLLCRLDVLPWIWLTTISIN